MKKAIRRFKLDENFDFNVISSMNKKELELLSEDIRELIIDRCSEFGGHLSSNLGVINLTIALFRNFDLNKDKIIFDIGHNTYTYKILTGRPLRDLRKENGCDGFQKIGESKYDFYDGGHSSTSISAALGFAKARDFKKEDYHCVAFIGDGGIANGLCFEALNNLIVDDTKLIVILNDNEMSISPTVGGLSSILKGIRNNPFVNIVFKDANFEYLGPVDGDNFDQMNMAFRKAKKSKRSVIVHVKTKKGEGYKYAEEDYVGEFHFVNPFDKQTGKTSICKYPKTVCFSKIFANLVDNDMNSNLNSFSICPSTTVGACLIDTFKKYKDRCFDCGISEEHSAVFANALAINGYKVNLFMYSTFLQRAYDEILHDIARMNSNVTLFIDRCGLVGPDGETHQGIYDESFFYSIPNFALSMPHDEADAIKLFKISREYSHPMAVRYPGVYEIHDYDFVSKNEIGFGEWDYIKSDSDDVALISFGPHLNDIYSKVKNMNISLINALFLKQYNEEEISKLLKFKKIFIYDPYGVESGFGANLVFDLTKHKYKGDLKIKALPLTFISKGLISEQEKRLNMDVDSVFNEFLNFINEN